MPPYVQSTGTTATSLMFHSRTAAVGDQLVEQKVKCVLVGDGAVGKTSLIVSYTTNGYPTEYIPTAYDNYSVVITVDNKPIQLQLCDTAGQDDFDSLRPLCYPQTDIFLLCFSVVSPTSFHNVLDKWVPEIRKHNKKTPILLVGTQCDLRNDVKVLIDLAKFHERPVTEDDAKTRAQRIRAIAYVECSALTQKNLKEVFDSVIVTALTHQAQRLEKKKSKKMNKYRVSDTEHVKKGWKKLCCFV